jgi:DNA-binding NarL/FixJ family response regulator
MLVEHDRVASREISALLQSLGYIVAAMDTPRAALNTAQTVRFDVVLTYTVFNADDRRSFIGEIARLAPQAPVILLLDDDTQVSYYHAQCGGVLAKPVTLRALRRVIEFGIDGNGAMPSCAAYPRQGQERRTQGQRRHRPR